METKINTALFINEFDKIALKFDAIRKLPGANLYSMDSIDATDSVLAIHCSERVRGDTDFETYYYNDEEINRPLDEWEKYFADLRIREQEANLSRQRLLEVKKAEERKLQYEQLKKEFGE